MRTLLLIFLLLLGSWATPSLAQTFTLTIQNGSGGGSYAAGDTVHLWAKDYPTDSVFDRWVGTDAQLVERTDEWHTRLVMPARAVNLAARFRYAAPFTLSSRTIRGVQRNKRVFTHFPANLRGVVFLFHGTGGSADEWTGNDDNGQLIRDLAARGYGVMITECEERTANQDFNNDGKIRWQATPLVYANNTDVQNLAALLDTAYARGWFAATTPILLLGMSNGGAFTGTAGLLLLQEGYPVRATNSYCADGIAAVYQITTVPNLYTMAQRDQNTQVSNADAATNAQNLANRGFCSRISVHPPSPLTAERMARFGYLNLSTAQTVLAEIRALGALDAEDIPLLPLTSSPVTSATPAQAPTLTGLTGMQRLYLSDLYNICFADHRFYSDYSGRSIAFFDSLCATPTATLPRADENPLALQVWPNPFNGSFSVNLSEAGDLSLWNLSGQRIWQQTTAAGTQEVWLGPVPEGVYILRLETADGQRHYLRVVKAAGESR